MVSKYRCDCDSDTCNARFLLLYQRPMCTLLQIKGQFFQFSVELLNVNLFLKPTQFLEDVCIVLWHLNRWNIGQAVVGIVLARNFCGGIKALNCRKISRGSFLWKRWCCRRSAESSYKGNIDHQGAVTSTSVVIGFQCKSANACFSVENRAGEGCSTFSWNICLGSEQKWREWCFRWIHCPIILCS